ncbi:mucin-1-like [Frankliniella occidentalis]|uniref:Mucin-1-like n=1 Tax=Frankliniella occidentalis TaxID=133901 RepID=A0A9C6X8H9_FRAOC|nr:mucin-1-like [Frankliniella occidentalis]
MPFISVDNQLSYHLVDFSEGPQIIPSNWLADDGCTCAWPHWADDLDQNAWDKAIRQLIEPQGHWKEAVIQRIRIKNSNFPYVRSKLKEAEEKSDTDLQSDAACGPNRQLRKRKVEDDECFIPKLPKFQSVKTLSSSNSEAPLNLNESIESNTSEIDGEFERLSFPPSPHSSPSSTLANTPSSLRRSNSGTSDKSVPTVSNGHKGGSITPSYTSKSGTSGTPNMMSLESPAQSNKPNRDSRTLSAQPSCSGTADKSVTTVNNGHEGGSITPFSTSKSGTSGIPSESAESPVHDSVLNSSDQAAWSRVPPHAAGVSDGSAESPMDESLSHPNISRDTSGKRVRESNVTPSSTIKERTMAMAESMTNVGVYLLFSHFSSSDFLKSVLLLACSAFTYA